MLKLKLHYFGHLMQSTDSLEKTLMLGMIEGGRRRGWQRMRWLDGITDLMDIEFEQALGVGDGQGSLACCSPWGRKESDTTEQLNWTVAQMPDLSCTLAWLGLWEAWGPWKEEQSLFEWTTTDHRGKELSKQAELAHCRRSGIVEQSQRGWGWENYFAVETKPNGLTEFIQEPVGRCNWSTSKWCLGLKVWNRAEAAQNISDVYFISLGEVTGSRLTHSIRTILPF